MLTFFWGVALAITIVSVKVSLQQTELLGLDFWHQVNGASLVSSIATVCLATAGARMAFAMPVNLRANWIFRLTDAGLATSLKATRLSLFAVAVAPALAIWSVLLWLWPWRPAAEHLILLALLGTILVEVCVCGFHKIPFTCSYLPGKANVYGMFFVCLFLLGMVLKGVSDWERQAFQHNVGYGIAVIGMIAGVIFARMKTMELALSEGAALQFEETERPEIEGLDLHKDGIMTIRSGSE